MKRPSRKPLPTLALAGLAATAALTISGVASAGNLTPVHWVKDPLVQPQYVQNGLLKANAPFLGIRSPKAGGGYTLNAICKGTDRQIYAAIPKYENSKWRVTCPANGEVINNPTYYTTESKAYAQQRGNISALSVEVKIGYMHRVLCYGVLPDGQRLPGYMDATRQGQLPDKCYVKIMGRGVGLTNWGVFKYKHNPNLPSSNAWWSPGNIKPATSDLPLYLLGNRGSEFCRGKPPGQSLYYFPGELVRANGNFFCRMTTLNGFQSVSSFQLYFVPRSSGPRLSPNWADGDHQAWSRGLRVSDGSEAYKRVYRCQQYTTKKFGFVRESDKRCRVPGVNSAAAEQKFKILWTH